MSSDHALAGDTVAFTEWLVKNGGYIHPDVCFQPVSSGYNVVAAHDIPADERIVSCPFALAITPEVSRQAILLMLSLGKTSMALSSWSERQLVCAYICLHRIDAPTKRPEILAHQPYVDILPCPEKLRTPLHFTRAELDLFKGTNLYGAALDRQRSWETEWQECKEFFSGHDALIGERFTWSEYLTAATYLSSRAFPSTLLLENPTLVASPDSYPVLLPGVDSLNHARAQPVSWLVSHPKPPSTATASTPAVNASISLVLHTPTTRGDELFNNYGPKPNAELILGYGFALRHSPDDTIVLKIGGGGQSTEQKWEVGRGARGIEPVWKAVQDAVRAQSNVDEEDAEAENGVDDELWATEVLEGMAEDLLSRLPQVPCGPCAGDDPELFVRPEVLQMREYYLEGQRDILNSIIDFAKAQETRIMKFAREQGIEIIEDDA